MSDPSPPAPSNPPLPPPSRVGARPASLWRQTLEEHETLEGVGPWTGGLSIGGWLVLVAIGRVLAIPLWAVATLANYRIFSQPRLWAALTQPGAPAYHPLWSTLIVYDFTGSLLLLVCSVWLAVLFFGRRKAFRLTMVSYALAVLVFHWGNVWLQQQIPAFSLHDTGAKVSTAFGVTISTLIWVPYYLISERVKHTFVK